MEIFVLRIFFVGITTFLNECTGARWGLSLCHHETKTIHTTNTSSVDKIYINK